MWHYFGYRIGSGSMSPECFPAAIFLVLTPYNVQLLWSFVCTTKLIQRLLHFINTPQFSHKIPLGWICLVMEIEKKIPLWQTFFLEPDAFWNAILWKSALRWAVYLFLTNYGPLQILNGIGTWGIVWCPQDTEKEIS